MGKSKTQRKQPSAKKASASRVEDRRWRLNGPKGKGKSSARVSWIPKKLQHIGEDAEDSSTSFAGASVLDVAISGIPEYSKAELDYDQVSSAAASTALPDDGASTLFGEDDRWLDVEDPEE